MKIKLIILTLLILIGAFTVRSPIEELLLKFKTYHYYFPGEKVYLHLNKEVFTNGETIWFKAYLVDAIQHQKDTLSGTLYVDLINADQNKVIAQRILEVRDGISKGDFYLPDSLPAANYQIRAYTKWMLNFDQDFIYTHDINLYHPDIFNQDWQVTSRITEYEEVDSVQLYFEMKPPLPPEIGAYDYEIRQKDGYLIDEGVLRPYQQGYFTLNIEIPSLDSVPEVLVKFWNRNKTERFVVPLLDRPEIRFFPEGGEMVSGLVSPVAFEIKDPEGKVLQIKGQLIDQDGKEVIPLETIHEGRGVLLFKPESGMKYQALIEYKGKKYHYPLPVAKTEGIVMSAINSYKDELDLRIYRNDKSGKFNGSFILIGQVRGKVYSANQFELDKKLGRIKIPKSVFPSGILQLTLFNENYLPIAERLVFINHNDFMQIDISADKIAYTPRDKITLKIKTTKPDGQPAPANLSASVVDINQLPVENSSNIISYLLLSSDLKGKIENPAQYFEKSDYQSQRKIDLLMMTRGWRRFKWEEIIRQNYPQFSFYPEQGLEISGQVTRLWNDNKPAENKEITLSIFGSQPTFAVTNSDSLGNFSFPNLYFHDTVTVIVQTANKKGNKREMNLYLDSTIVTPDIQAPVKKLPVNSTIYNYLQSSEERKQIELAYIRDTTTRILDGITVEGLRIEKDEDRFKIYGKADVTLEPGNDASGFFSIIEYLNGRVAGLQVIGSGPDAQVLIRGGGGGFFSGGASGPLFLLDGVPVDQSMINSIPMQDVKSIDVLKNAGSTAIYGSRGAGGVIAVYTKRGEFRQEEVRGISNVRYPGFYVPKEFYAPDYDTPKDEHIMPDRRAVVDWEPDLCTDSTGTTTLSFHNADLKTEVKVVVQGISFDGIPGYQELVYEVR